MVSFVLFYEQFLGTSVLPGRQCIVGLEQEQELGMPAEMLPVCERRLCGTLVGTQHHHSAVVLFAPETLDRGRFTNHFECVCYVYILEALKKYTLMYLCKI